MNRIVALLLMIVPCIISCSGNRTMNVRVVVPASTPPGAEIYIAGNHPLLGDWNPGAVRLSRSNDSVWQGAFDIPAGTPLEFKITRGSWKTEALYVAAELPPNISVAVRKDTTVELHPLAWADNATLNLGTITGTVRSHQALRGEGLEYARDLIVWLPPSYESARAKRYPVLYMHDGQNVFDPATSFAGYDWHADEVADSLIRAGEIEEIIIVGIYNSPDRIAEYGEGKKGRAYQEFVVRTVKPFVDRTYRTMPDREHTAVMGSSMGGLVSFLLAWRYPEVFSKAGCLSSVFDRRTSIVDTVAQSDEPRKPIRIYMDCGGAGGDETLMPGMDAMAAALTARGYVPGTDVAVFSDPLAGHHERAWAARLWRPMKFLFPKN